MGRETAWLPPVSWAGRRTSPVDLPEASVERLAERPLDWWMAVSLEPSVKLMVWVVEPLAAFSVVTTVPSLRLSSTRWEPSGRLVVTVTVPVALSVVVVTVLLIGGGWMMETLQDYTYQVFALIATY